MSDETRGQEKRNARQNKKWRKNVGKNRIEWLNSMRQMDANRCNGEDDNRQKLSNEIEFGRRVRTKRNEWMKNVHGDFVRLSNSNPTDTKWQRQCFNEVYRKYVAFSLPFRFFFFVVTWRCRHVVLALLFRVCVFAMPLLPFMLLLPALSLLCLSSAHWFAQFVCVFISNQQDEKQAQQQHRRLSFVSTCLVFRFVFFLCFGVVDSKTKRHEI